MKKILSAIVLFALVVLPMSVMAMTTISDNELSTVTGQAGVSINVDFTANLHIGTVAWGDSDGLDGADTASVAGFVGITELDMQIHMSGRHDGPFGPLASTNANYLLNDPITIDVGTDTASGASQVRIGLPTAHITVDNLDFDIFLSAADTNGDPATPQVLGSIYMSGIEVLLGQGTDASVASTYDAGYVTIGAASAAANAGVAIGFDVKIDAVTIDVLSYGNAFNIIGAAFPGYTSGGYVGLRDFALDNINISGGVNIGVGTLNGAAMGYTDFGSPTMVNIVINNGTKIEIPGSIKGTVLLASNNTLDAENVGELGNFFIGGVSLEFVDNNGSFASNSLIQIWAH